MIWKSSHTYTLSNTVNRFELVNELNLYPNIAHVYFNWVRLIVTLWAWLTTRFKWAIHEVCNIMIIQMAWREPCDSNSIVSFYHSPLCVRMFFFLFFFSIYANWFLVLIFYLRENVQRCKRIYSMDITLSVGLWPWLFTHHIKFISQRII